MATVNAPSPELFFETATAYQRTAALKAAVELGLFTAIGDGARTASAAAAACHATERGVRMLCDYLTVVGLLQKNGGEYALTQDSAVFLSKRSPAYLGGVLQFINAKDLMQNADHLAETIRTGKLPESGDTVSDENPLWVEFARAMVPMAMPAAQVVAGLVQAETAAPLKVLDIAAGHGMYGITIAERNPRAEITAVDWKSVLGVALEHARRAGVEGRYHTLPGSAFDVDFGGGYDLALVTNFLHHFDQPTCTAFLQKVARALQPGGRIVVVEMVPNDDRVSPPFPAAFVMNMLAGTQSGDAYTFAQLQEMLAAAGFSGPSAHPTQGPQTVLIAARQA